MKNSRFTTIGQEWPKTSPHFRIKNLGNASAMETVRVTGGNPVIYNENSANRLLYRKRDMDEWKTCTSGQQILINGLGNYVDFKVVQSGDFEVNSGIATDFLHFDIPNFDSLVLGNLSCLTNSYQHVNNALNGLLSNNKRLVHASGLTVPGAITGTSGFAMGFYNCWKLQTPPVFYNTNNKNTILGEHAFHYLFTGCSSLLSAADFHYNRFNQYACCYAYFGCIAITEPAPLSANSVNSYCFQNMYAGCSSIRTLSAIYLAPTGTMHRYACQGMFADCTALTDIGPYYDAQYQPYGVGHQLLPCLDLGEGCYMNMFMGCTNLYMSFFPAQLPAPVVPKYGYAYMFQDCPHLQQMLPMSALNEVKEGGMMNMYKNCSMLKQTSRGDLTSVSSMWLGAFASMFEGCHALSSPIDLPRNDTRTIPAQAMGVFHSMFKDCWALTAAPSLPYVNAQSTCFAYMFAGCSSLTEAPTLLMEDPLNIGGHAMEGMFSGCSNLHKITTHQLGWAAVVGSTSTYFQQDWVAGVATTGNFYCKDYIYNNPEFGASRIPFNNANPWQRQLIVDTPFVRYQDFTAELANTWPGVSAYNSSNELLALGLYVGTNIGKDSIVYNVSLDPYSAVTKVPYPWSPATNYTISTSWYVESLGALPNAVEGISANNEDHTWDIPSSQGVRTWPDIKWEGFTNPYVLSCTYTPDSGDPSTVLCGFVFVILQDDATWVDNNIMLIGASGLNCVVEISGIPAIDSYVMIRKYDKSTGRATTQWCDTTGWWKLRIPIDSSEWLGIKNGCSKFENINMGGGQRAPVDPMLDHPYRISILNSTRGVLSGNVKSLGSIYFLKNLDGNEVAGFPISFWGQNVLREMFKGCTGLQQISPNFFKDVNFWCCPSGCYAMFSGCTNLIATPKITTYYGAYDPYIFYRMFAGCTKLTAAYLDTTGEYPNDAPMYFKQHACDEMFKGCTHLSSLEISGNLSAGCGVTETLNYYTRSGDDLTIHSLQTTGLGAFQNMFSGCTGLRSENTSAINIGRFDRYSCASMFNRCTNLYDFSGYLSAGLNLGNIKEGACSTMFSGCTHLDNIDFEGTTGIVCDNTVGYQFAHMFEECDSLDNVFNFKLNSAAPYCCQNMFYLCESLKSAGINITCRGYTNSFVNMFAGCTGLTGVQKFYLSGTAEACCKNMFYNCKSLTNANNAISITNDTDTSCYETMFVNCSSLIIAPTIILDSRPETSAPSCCQSMFSGCWQLTDFPLEIFCAYNVISAYSYCGMFLNCYSLNLGLNIPYDASLMYDVTSYEFVNLIPRLNTIGFDACLSGMFKNCTGLQVTPILENLGNAYLEGSRLSVTNHVPNEHAYMFFGTKSLTAIIIELQPIASNYIRTLYGGNGQENASETYMFVEKLQNVQGSGTVKASGVTIYDNLSDSFATNIRFKGDGADRPMSAFWNSTVSDGTQIVLPNVNEMGNVNRIRHVYIQRPGMPNDPLLGSEQMNTPLTFKAIGGGGVFKWNVSGLKYKWHNSDQWQSYTANSEIEFTSANTAIQLSGDYSGNITTKPYYSGSAMKVYGNVNSVYNWTNGMKYHVGWFSDAAWLTDAGGLYMPADLARGEEHSWQRMFFNCINLTQPPRVIGGAGFVGTTYSNALKLMFAGCKRMTYAPSFNTTLDHNYDSQMMYMFSGCTALNKANNILIIECAPSCCYGMFDGCTALTQGAILRNNPEYSKCWQYMFRGCRNLTVMSTNFTSWNAANTYLWVNGVGNVGTFYKSQPSLPDEFGINYIPSGWTVIVPD